MTLKRLEYTLLTLYYLMNFSYIFFTGQLPALEKPGFIHIPTLKKYYVLGYVHIVQIRAKSFDIAAGSSAS